MFASQRVRLATIVIVGSVAVAAVVGADRYQGSRADAAVRRDRAAVEVAARPLTYAQVAAAWMRMKRFHGTPLAEIQSSVGVRPRTVQEEDGAIILTFASGCGSRDVYLDFAEDDLPRSPSTHVRISPDWIPRPDQRPARGGGSSEGAG